MNDQSTTDQTGSARAEALAKAIAKLSEDELRSIIGRACARTFDRSFGVGLATDQKHINKADPS